MPTERRPYEFEHNLINDCLQIELAKEKEGMNIH